MIKFSSPNQLNGKQLRDELNAANVKISNDRGSITMDEVGDLWLDISDKDKTKAEKVIADHVAVFDTSAPTIEQKLESVGLNLEDLKAALGL
jgi:hypothetical protein